jgi:hypothetical protein
MNRKHVSRSQAADRKGSLSERLNRKPVSRSQVADRKDSLPERLDSFFRKQEKRLLVLSLAAGALMSVLMFDCKVSLSGDDCDYIVNAERFIHHFAYPGGRGALYPMVLAPFLVGGLHLLFLKALSAVFILLSMWLMYKTFRELVPPAVLMPALFLANICSYVYFYASYTYSEPFFMLTQSLFLYVLSRFFRKGEPSSDGNLSRDWRKFLGLGLCFLAMGLTRTIGYAVMGAVILYFCLEKQWKNLLYSGTASVLAFALFSGIKKMVWPDSGAAYNIYNYLAKNFYGVEQGLEDLPGFLNRLVTNSNVYLSWFFYQFLGLRDCSEEPLTELPLLTLFTYCLFFLCLTVVCRKNRALFFTGLYVGVMNFASFLLLQTMWAQDRLIMIYYPLMLLFVLGGLYYLLPQAPRLLRRFYPVLLILLAFTTLTHTKERVARNLPVLQQNLLGNDLYGLTPDWENFVRMSRWANDHLDKEAVLVSRKPSISYIYTGRQFSGIFNVLYVNMQDIENQYREEKDSRTFIAVEIPEQHPLLNEWDPYLHHIYVTKPNGVFTINDKPIAGAFVFRLNNPSDTEALIRTLEAHHFNYTLDYEAFYRQYRDDRNLRYQVVDPDMLLQYLTDMKADYLLLPKIRLYTAENTGYYLNTIHQYLSFIQYKYPNRFRLIHEIGKEETCELAEFFRK